MRARDVAFPEVAGRESRLTTGTAGTRFPTMPLASELINCPEHRARNTTPIDPVENAIPGGLIEKTIFEDASDGQNRRFLESRQKQKPSPGASLGPEATGTDSQSQETAKASPRLT